MDEIEITGGRKLKGGIKISGSKNSALPVLISTLLTDEECFIGNVPRLRDINTAVLLLSHLGKNVKPDGNCLSISDNSRRKKGYDAPYDLIKRMRASFLVAGPLLAKYGRAEVSLPGGCAIGVRPVDIHLDGFRKLGAKVTVRKGNVMLSSGKLKGCRIPMKFPSVGATENLMMAASLASGVTRIENAAREPEISDLADFMGKAGAEITGAGTGTITIRGRNRLQGASHRVIPDRIETGTYLIAGAITRGDVTLSGCNPAHVQALLSKLEDAGARVDCTCDTIRIRAPGRIRPVDVVTSPYPGFPTDLQAQWMTLMCTAAGKSAVRESVFENRFMHVAELQRLGAGLRTDGDRVAVSGNGSLTGATVMVSDLRAGAALVLAGLVAKGKTVITRVYHLDRGYENFEKKLSKAGAVIRRIRK